MINRNPLRYPGGKHFLAGYIKQVLLAHDLEGCVFYEPYAGSAAVSLALLSDAVIEQAILVEKDPLVYSFWYSVMRHPDELCRLVSNVDVSMATWAAMAPYRDIITPLEEDVLELGLAGLFINRTSYSGILKAGPLGGNGQRSPYGIGCRFNKQTIIQHIQRISTAFEGRLHVHWGDALEFMRDNYDAMHGARCFAYIDPPYYEQGKSLYRHFYSDDDHERLAEFMAHCTFPWLISYDDHPFISDLYFNGRTHIHGIYRDYSVGSQPKRAKELLISNMRIPPTKTLRYSVSVAND